LYSFSTSVTGRRVARVVALPVGKELSRGEIT
jgi:hypothetical protein